MDLKNFVASKPNINSVRFGKGSFRYFGPVISNFIPAEIRNANTLCNCVSSVGWIPNEFA